MPRDRLAPAMRMLVPAALALLAGCSALPAAGPPVAAQPARELRVPQVLAAEGLQKLAENRYEDASRIFNAGLKFAPDNAQLHFLNGLAYQLLYLRGDEAMKDLAAAGFHLALEADPGLLQAALQLGRLEFAARRYAPALEAFRHAARIDGRHGEAWLGQASAAYYLHDLPAARAAIDRALPLLQDNADAMRAAALIYAALGEPEQARAALARHALLEPKAQAQLMRRIDQWQDWRIGMGKVDGGAQMLKVMQVLPQPEMPPLQQASPQPAMDPGMQAVPGVREPAMPSWSDCGAPGFSPGMGGGMMSGASSNSADETTPLPALPPPCKGARNPHMAILDVVIVRTEDNASSSHGINLLDGLTYVFNQTKAVADVITQATGAADARNVTVTRTRSSSFPGTAGFGYSLNIANSTDARSEVLARPSLVALDRQPSTFFSGRNLTLGVAGANGGTSTIADKAIGVSLSVTPTFIDADSMLVAVKAGRSFVEQVDFNVAFPHSLQTSRNAVTANVVLKFGETLILSGLTEHEVQRNTTGVPILQDIPLVQYLFRERIAQNFTRSVLVMITPRKVEGEQAQMARNLSELERWNGGARKDLIPQIAGQMATADGGETNLDALYKHQLHNELFLQFRSGDIRSNDWSQPGRLKAFFLELGGLLYF